MLAMKAKIVLSAKGSCTRFWSEATVTTLPLLESQTTGPPLSLGPLLGSQTTGPYWLSAFSRSHSPLGLSSLSSFSGFRLRISSGPRLALGAAGHRSRLPPKHGGCEDPVALRWQTALCTSDWEKAVCETKRVIRSTVTPRVNGKIDGWRLRSTQEDTVVTTRRDLESQQHGELWIEKYSVIAAMAELKLSPVLLN